VVRGRASTDFKRIDLTLFATLHDHQIKNVSRAFWIYWDYEDSQVKRIEKHQLELEDEILKYGEV
jgi:hypothetical protein